jgi:hypothetical protein
MLFAIPPHKNIIDVESIAVSLMPTLESPGISGTEFYAPKPDCFVADSDTSFRE